MTPTQFHLALGVAIARLAYELAARVTITLVLTAQAAATAASLVAVGLRQAVGIRLTFGDALHRFLARVRLAAP